MNIRTTVLLLALGSAATVPVDSISAQAPDCFTNLVPNGDFEALFPNTWVFTGSGTGNFPVMANVRGDGDSNALRVSSSGPFTVAQPTAFTLQAGQTYRFSVDLFSNTGNWTLSVDMVDSTGGRQTVFSRGFPSFTTYRAKPEGLFSVANTGSYTIELRGSAASTNTSFDNVRITEHGGPLFRITDQSIATSNNAYDILGAPGDLTAVLFSIGLGSPVSVPGFGDVPLLLDTAVIITAIQPTFLNGAGSFSGRLSVPPATAGFLVAFQPISLNSLQFGCPTQVVF